MSQKIREFFHDLKYMISSKNKIVREVPDNIAIRVSNLYSIYDEKTEHQLVALNNINYDFEKNKIYFIIGSSGSGKTTLVTHFNGLLTSKYGYVQVGDIVIGDHFNITPHLIGAINTFDKKIINVLWRYKLDQWTFLILYSKEIDKQKASILFEAKYKHKPKKISFINNLEFTNNKELMEKCKIGIVRVSQDVLLEIKNKFSFDDLENITPNVPEIKTNYKFNKKIKRFKDLRKRVGFVFQFPEYQLFKDTIEKDIMFGPLNLGVKKKEAKERAKFYLNKLGLDDSYLERNPFGLSGGQKRRVAIAGILAIKNDILVFDEPTAGLDPVGEQEMMKIILEAKAEDKTIFVITHTMDHVLEIADEVVVMDDGEIIASGDPYSIFLDEDLMKSSPLQYPRVLSVVKQLIDRDKEKWSKLIEYKPRTVEELADKIRIINKKERS
ncbi:ATP-binding cassette domain-containing protein [Ureaplasma canigenitalium]|uniref:ATP-binding cassette domain-containing protein n=1 Tax=Ureaplasma canigenitalium TaxID=42092 RepID=UPI000B05E8C0|nr:ATP-binding cassette domain-containing protein [Ureaplasma canigenitalium]